MAIEIAGLDVNSGLELCDGNKDIYVNSLRLYVSNIPKSLEKMKGVSEATLKDYAISVHGVKSISDYIGAQEVKKTAKELEAMAKAGNLAGVLAKNETFIKYAQNLVNNIRIWLEKSELGVII